MNELIIKHTQPNIEAPACPISLKWADNPDIQNLLDIAASIIADEYIEIAKKNPEIFKNISNYTDLDKITQIKQEEIK